MNRKQADLNRNFSNLAWTFNFLSNESEATSQNSASEWAKGFYEGRSQAYSNALKWVLELAKNHELLSTGQLEEVVRMVELQGYDSDKDKGDDSEGLPDDSEDNPLYEDGEGGAVYVNRLHELASLSNRLPQVPNDRSTPNETA